MLFRSALSVGLLLVLGSAGIACGGEGQATEGSDEEASELDLADPMRARLPDVFLVETPSVAIPQKLTKTPPGGIVFWNLSRAGAKDVRSSIRAASKALEAAGKPPMLFSTDYEGGGLSQTTSFSNIAGIQRFTDGFTRLAHPSWIGAAYQKNPQLGRELAELHGHIAARELRSVGLNYPLAAVSDLQYSLFLNRSIGKDERVVGELVGKILEGNNKEPGVVFVSKHFPGLGQTRGDTHENLVVSTATPAESERHLLPFAELIKNANGSEPVRLSLMCGHAKYPAFDDVENTTVSPKIATGLLRERLGFRGLSVSDAMWMGPYGSMSGAPLMRIYARSFLAGMDLLMIPGAKYDEALKYFRDLYDGTLSQAERATLAQEAGLGTPDALDARLRSRLRDAQERLTTTRAKIGHAHVNMDEGDAAPSTVTTAMRERYTAILKEVDARWGSVSR